MQVNTCNSLVTKNLQTIKGHSDKHDPSTTSANALTDALANVSLTHHQHVGQKNTNTSTDTRSTRWTTYNQGIGQYNTVTLKIHNNYTKIVTFFLRQTVHDKKRNLLKALDFLNVSFSQKLAEVLKSLSIVPYLHSVRLVYVEFQAISYWMFSNSTPQDTNTVTLILHEKVSHTKKKQPQCFN